MNSRITCLDNGYVRLVASMGDDLSIVRSARVSHDAAWRAGDDTGSDAKLIRYLMKHRHSTPFESVQFTFEVKAPIFVIRQWHRHRTWSYNELSARYTELPEEFYVPDLDKIGVQSKSNKQGRIFVSDATAWEDDGEKLSVQQYEYFNSCRNSFENYQELIAGGWPRELARCVLPMATYTKMFATVNLWNLLHFITLRNDSHSQYEIQVYAKAVAELAKSVAPVCMAAYEESKQ